MHDLTDEEASEQFCFNIQWHYALNITSPDDAASYIISGKSIWTMCDKLSTEEAYHDLFAIFLKWLAEIFTVDFKKRIDSVHVQSNMCHLGIIQVGGHLW